MIRLVEELLYIKNSFIKESLLKRTINLLLHREKSE